MYKRQKLDHLHPAETVAGRYSMKYDMTGRYELIMTVERVTCLRYCGNLGHFKEDYPKRGEKVVG